MTKQEYCIILEFGQYLKKRIYRTNRTFLLMAMHHFCLFITFLFYFTPSIIHITREYINESQNLKLIV